MSLIEELGGYERAKEIAFDPLYKQMTHVSNDGRHRVNEEFAHIPSIAEQIKGMVKISEIRHALLEYRREHGIYEVGDKVVSDDSGMIMIFGDGCEKWFCLRHATDLEIKAGHRLP